MAHDPAWVTSALLTSNQYPPSSSSPVPGPSTSHLMFKDPGWRVHWWRLLASLRCCMCHQPVVTTRPGRRGKQKKAAIGPCAATGIGAGESLLTGTLQGPPAQEPSGPSLATEAAAEAFFWPVVGGWHVQPAIDLTEAGTEGQDIESRTQ